MSTNPKKIAANLKYNERTKQIIEGLESITSINSDTHEVIVDDFSANVWEKYLPDNITTDIVNDLNTYRKDLCVATTDVFGRMITDHAIANDDLGKMDVRVESPDIDFGFSYARPSVDKPTARHHRNAINSYAAIRHDSLELEVLDGLASLWDAADEE